MGKNLCNIYSNKKFKLISKKVRDSKKHQILQCQNCSHAQLFPLPTTSENQKFYDEDRMTKNIGVKSINIIKKKP